LLQGSEQITSWLNTLTAYNCLIIRSFFSSSNILCSDGSSSWKRLLSPTTRSSVRRRKWSACRLVECRRISTQFTRALDLFIVSNILIIFNERRGSVYLLRQLNG
jgi:hypothetical protein